MKRGVCVDALPTQRDDDGRMPAMVLLPVLAYAERYPALPVFSIVECLLDAWRDAALTYIDDDWMGSFDHIVTERLDHLMASESLDPRATGRSTAHQDRPA
jgi:hypothetical protein